MKYKLLHIVLLIITTTVFLIGCGGDDEKYYCAKCGSEAKYTVSGTAHSMENEGINLNKCEQTQTDPIIYTAHLCDKCNDKPVVKNPLLNH